MKGWQCPVCGGGVAPGVERCPCVAVGTTHHTSIPATLKSGDTITLEHTFHLPATDDGWIEWKGGNKPPVSGEVFAKFRDDSTGRRDAARYDWVHNGGDDDIVAFKVLP